MLKRGPDALNDGDLAPSSSGLASRAPDPSSGGIDRAIWGVLEGAGPQASKATDEDSGRIDLTALIAEAQAEMASKRGETQSAGPLMDAHPLLVFPFGPPSAPAAPVPAPAPAPPEDVVPRFHKIKRRFLVVPVALIIIGAVLTAMAVGKEPEPVPVASSVAILLPPTPAPAPAPPPSASGSSVEEIKTPALRPTATARSSSVPVRRRLVPPPSAPSATQGTTTTPPAAPVDPCKGDLVCAMKRATERR